MNRTRTDRPGPLSPLQARVLREIVAYVRRERLQTGAHLREQELAARAGTSRTPVLQGLRHLETLGALRRDANRGFFLRRGAVHWAGIARRLAAVPDDPLYLRIAQLRQSGALPEAATEAELMRRLGAARGALRKVLARIAAEDWVEQRPGHGWRFRPTIDSAGAYAESYAFRLAIEPAALRQSGFRADPQELAALREEQAHIVSGGYLSLTPVELFEANARFHEALARWSGNRFLLQGLQRVNQLRRLEEYRQAGKRPERRTQAREHLGILAATGRGDQEEAAHRMQRHLLGARRRKAWTSGR